MINPRTNKNKFISNVKKQHTNWNLYEKLIFGINFLVSLAFLIYSSFVTPQDKNYWTIWVAFFGNVFNIFSVILAVKKRVICFFWGILTVIAFGAISFNNKAFGNTISYWGFYIPAQIIAWVLWYRASNDKIEIKPTTIKWWGIVIAVIASVGLIALFTWIETLNGFQKFWYNMSTNDQGQLVDSNGNVIKFTLLRDVLDSSIFILPITLSVFAWLRFRERWVLSIFIDSIQTIFWILLATGYDQKPKGPEVNANWIMMISSLTMLIAAVYGTYNWYKHSTNNVSHK